MQLEELNKRIQSRQLLEQQAKKPAGSYDPTEGMNENELRNYCRFLYEQVQTKDTQLQCVQDTVSEIKEQNKAILKKINSFEKENKKLRRENETLQNRLDVLNKEHFDSKSQKGLGKNNETVGKNDKRPDYDGTPESLGETDKSDSNDNTTTDDQSESTDNETKKVYHGPYRKGAKYNKQTVANPIRHEFDQSKLPEGTVVIKAKPYVVRHVISKIEEHVFERLVVRYRNGKTETIFIPYDEDKEGAAIYREVVPCTHITADLLSYLLFNKFQMASPYYREAKNRLSDMNWHTCRQNLANWSDKGAIILNKLIPALKDKALEKGANVNVDETWCRYQTHYGHKKTYMWCLVNKKARIVIFFYEDCEDEDGKKHEGGRSRKVLTDFLDGSDINSLQSDGYNVYMYLDDELVDTEHLCCMAHVRAKFKYALNQGCERAGFFIEMIGCLYRREALYKKLGYSPGQIKEARNDEYTTGIIEKIEGEMFDLLALPETEMSELMIRALNYFHKFWKQVFNYRNNGEYTIDNLEADRAIRPMTIQRKNSLFFGSTKGATNSAIYNTFISTCTQLGISFRDYFKRCIRELKSGRTDYENLLPMTINLVT